MSESDILLLVGVATPFSLVAVEGPGGLVLFLSLTLADAIVWIF